MKINTLCKAMLAAVAVLGIDGSALCSESTVTNNAGSLTVWLTSAPYASASYTNWLRNATHSVFANADPASEFTNPAAYFGGLDISRPGQAIFSSAPGFNIWGGMTNLVSPFTGELGQVVVAPVVITCPNGFYARDVCFQMLSDDFYGSFNKAVNGCLATNIQTHQLQSWSQTCIGMDTNGVMLTNGLMTNAVTRISFTGVTAGFSCASNGTSVEDYGSLLYVSNYLSTWGPGNRTVDVGCAYWLVADDGTGTNVLLGSTNWLLAAEHIHIFPPPLGSTNAVQILLHSQTGASTEIDGIAGFRQGDTNALGETYGWVFAASMSDRQTYTNTVGEPDYFFRVKPPGYQQSIQLGLRAPAQPPLIIGSNGTGGN